MSGSLQLRRFLTDQAEIWHTYTTLSDLKAVKISLIEYGLRIYVCHTRTSGNNENNAGEHGSANKFSLRAQLFLASMKIKLANRKEQN